MKLLNLCAGANRDQGEEWYNLDSLRSVLNDGTPERANLDAEPRYLDHDVIKCPLPFPDGYFSGILASHCLEHWTCQEAAYVMKDSLRVLSKGGALMVSVPDASYFRQVYNQDTIENAEKLFGEPIYLPDGENTFFGYGLWNRFHKTILTEDALWCYFMRSGFANVTPLRAMNFTSEPIEKMTGLLNRLAFSLVMVGFRP